MQVAELFAKIGFKVDQDDIRRVGRFLDDIRESLNKAVQEASNFATALTKVTHATGLTSEAVQKFRQIGVEAGVGADEMDNILRVTQSLARTSHWGFTNTLARWGVYLNSSETSASVLLKILKQASSLDINRQRELFDEAGLDISEAMMLLDKFKAGTFDADSIFGMSNEDTKNLQKVDSIYKSISYKQEQISRYAFSAISGDLLTDAKVADTFMTKIFSIVKGISDNSFFKRLLALTYRGTNLLPIFSKASDITSKVVGVFKTFSGAGIKLAKFSTIVVSLTALFKALMGWNDSFENILTSLGKGFPSLNNFQDTLWNEIKPYIVEFSDVLRNYSGFDSGFVKVISNIIDKLINVIDEKGILGAIGKGIDGVISFLKTLVGSMFRVGKAVVTYLLTLISNRLPSWFNLLTDTLINGIIDLLNSIIEKSTTLSWYVGGKIAKPTPVDSSKDISDRDNIAMEKLNEEYNDAIKPLGDAIDAYKNSIFDGSKEAERAIKEQKLREIGDKTLRDLLDFTKRENRPLWKVLKSDVLKNEGDSSFLYDNKYINRYLRMPEVKGSSVERFLKLKQEQNISVDVMMNGNAREVGDAVGNAVTQKLSANRIFQSTGDTGGAVRDDFSSVYNGLNVFG